MRRRSPLSVHRKNEFRKMYARQRGYSVTVNTELPVRIPLHLEDSEQCKSVVSSLPEPLKISVSLDLNKQAQLNFDVIQTSEILQIMPKDKCTSLLQ